MSLTGFLKQSVEVRTLLRSHFPYPHKSIPFPLVQAPPLTGNYALVGQAFDYLLRFYMQKHNPSAPKKTHWVADFIKLPLAREDEEIQQRKGIEASALAFLENAHAHHERYLEGDKVTDELLASCLDLAIIDGLVRAGEIRGSLGKIDPKDIRDLRNLFALIPSTPFLDGNPCILNPVFPFPSGADCDLLIDDTLIEIKTTKFSEMKQEYYQQLLGYCLLNLTSDQPRVIRRIGVYFSRHGYLWSSNMNDIATNDTFLHFLPVWDELVQNYHGARTHRENTFHTIGELTTQVNALNGVTSYMYWLSRLSSTDFFLWREHPTAFYYAHGAIEAEQERRKRSQIKVKDVS